MAGKRKAAPPKRPSKQPPEDESPTGRVWLRRTVKWGLIGGLVLALVGAGGFFWFYSTVDIPNPNDDFLTETTHVYYDGGKQELGSFAVQRRESIDLDDMPDTIKDAVVAAENQSFWTDEGIDPKGIMRAAFSNAQGNAKQGASTITQQYVKILYLTQDQTWSRKAKEAVLSLKVQNRVTKEEVLEGYLNTIYFGRGAYGVEAASQAYFGIPAKKLKVRQAALLATVLNNPTRFDPANGEGARSAAETRYQYVLSSMADMGAITDEKAEKAAKRLPKLPDQKSEDAYGGQKGHMLKMIRNELVELGFSQEEIDGGGLKVTTTFTKRGMGAAIAGVKEARPEGFSDEQLHVGVASVEPGTGAVRGIYGGQDYLKSQHNWAINGGQAGSIFKPIALAAGLKAGFSLKDTFNGDSPLELPDGDEIENQGNQPYGRVNMVKATEDSINTAYIDMTMGMDDGPSEIVSMANAMGVPSDEPAETPYGIPARSPGLKPFLSVGLGPQTVSPINMANAYGTVANGGVRTDPYVIEKVVDDEGRTRYNHKATESRAMSEDIAADVSYAMQRTAQYGSGSGSSVIGRSSAGKTGTATNEKGWVTSAWYVGYTPQLATGVVYTRGDGVGQLEGWLPSFFGSDYPLDTWNAVMSRALDGEPVEEFPPPANVDGDAPTDGHEPPPPPPKTTKAPKQTEEPEPEPEKTKPTKPSKPPKTTEPTSPSETEDPSDDGSSDSDGPGDGGGNGGGNGRGREEDDDGGWLGRSSRETQSRRRRRTV